MGNVDGYNLLVTSNSSLKRIFGYSLEVVCSCTDADIWYLAGEAKTRGKYPSATVNYLVNNVTMYPNYSDSGELISINGFTLNDDKDCGCSYKLRYIKPNSFNSKILIENALQNNGQDAVYTIAIVFEVKNLNNNICILHSEIPSDNDSTHVGKHIMLNSSGQFLFDEYPPSGVQGAQSPISTNLLADVSGVQIIVFQVNHTNNKIQHVDRNSNVLYKYSETTNKWYKTNENSGLFGDISSPLTNFTVLFSNYNFYVSNTLYSDNLIFNYDTSGLNYDGTLITTIDFDPELANVLGNSPRTLFVTFEPTENSGYICGYGDWTARSMFTIYISYSSSQNGMQIRMNGHLVQYDFIAGYREDIQPYQKTTIAFSYDGNQSGYLFVKDPTTGEWNYEILTISDSLNTTNNTQSGFRIGGMLDQSQTGAESFVGKIFDIKLFNLSATNVNQIKQFIGEGTDETIDINFYSYAKWDSIISHKEVLNLTIERLTGQCLKPSDLLVNNPEPEPEPESEPEPEPEEDISPNLDIIINPTSGIITENENYKNITTDAYIVATDNYNLIEKLNYEYRDKNCNLIQENVYLNKQPTANIKSEPEIYFKAGDTETSGSLNSTNIRYDNVEFSTDLNNRLYADLRNGQISFQSVLPTHDNNSKYTIALVADIDLEDSSSNIESDFYENGLKITEYVNSNKYAGLGYLKINRISQINNLVPLNLISPLLTGSIDITLNLGDLELFNVGFISEKYLINESKSIIDIENSTIDPSNYSPLKLWQISVIENGSKIIQKIDISGNTYQENVINNIYDSRLTTRLLFDKSLGKYKYQGLDSNNNVVSENEITISSNINTNHYFYISDYRTNVDALSDSFTINKFFINQIDHDENNDFHTKQRYKIINFHSECSDVEFSDTSKLGRNIQLDNVLKYDSSNNRTLKITEHIHEQSEPEPEPEPELDNDSEILDINTNCIKYINYYYYSSLDIESQITNDSDIIYMTNLNNINTVNDFINYCIKLLYQKQHLYSGFIYKESPSPVIYFNNLEWTNTSNLILNNTSEIFVLNNKVSDFDLKLLNSDISGTSINKINGFVQIDLLSEVDQSELEPEPESEPELEPEPEPETELDLDEYVHTLLEMTDDNKLIIGSTIINGPHTISNNLFLLVSNITNYWINNPFGTSSRAPEGAQGTDPNSLGTFFDINGNAYYTIDYYAYDSSDETIVIATIFRDNDTNRFCKITVTGDYVDNSSKYYGPSDESPIFNNETELISYYNNSISHGNNHNFTKVSNFETIFVSRLNDYLEFSFEIPMSTALLNITFKSNTSKPLNIILNNSIISTNFAEDYNTDSSFLNDSFELTNIKTSINKIKLTGVYNNIQIW